MPSVVITGGGTGIGLATVRAMASDGWSVTVCGRRPDVLRDAAREAGSRGVVRTAVADLEDPDVPDRIVTEHLAAFAGLDAVVYASGVFEEGSVLDTTVDVWTRTLAVHIRGAALLCRSAGALMAEAGKGRIVLLSSINGIQSEPETAAYSAAKAAVASLARSVAVDLGARGVTCNAVSPGWVSTPMTSDALARATPEDLRRINPLGRAGRPDEVANLIHYLLTSAPAFLTGTNLVIDGGQTTRAIVV